MERQEHIVFLLHGFLRGKYNMVLFQNAFKKHNIQTVNWIYKSRSKKIEQHGKDLVVALQKISHQHPYARISFVTYSMGGLVVASALGDQECPSNARRGSVYAIAPPFQGSSLARKLGFFPLIAKILGSEAGSQLMTMTKENVSNITASLEGRRLKVIAGKIVINPFLRAPNDGILLVEETKPNFPHEHATYFGAHASLCYQSEVIQDAVNWTLFPENHEKTQNSGY